MAKRLYDDLIDIYIRSGKSENELLELLEQAGTKTGDPIYLKKKEEVVAKISTFDPPPGEYKKSVAVSIKKGAEIDKVYYTLDGSEPTNQSTEYKDIFTLNVVDHRVKEIRKKGNA